MDVRVENLRLPVDAKTELYIRSFRPEYVDRSLLIVHGAGEHGARYDHFAAIAAERDWRVVTVDLRGHGHSGGIPMHLNTFEDYLADLDAVFAALHLDQQRTALYAHSMGGLVAARYVQTRRPALAGVVLASPLLGLRIPVPRLKRTVGRFLSRVAPRFRFRTLVDPAATTRNLEVLRRRETDPLMRRTVTAGWFFQVEAAIALAHRDAADVQVPLLLLQGEQDEIVDPEAPKRWIRDVSSTDATLRLFDDHYHELINEPDWRDTAAIVLDWLDERLPSMASDRRSTERSMRRVVG